MSSTIEFPGAATGRIMLFVLALGAFGPTQGTADDCSTAPLSVTPGSATTVEVCVGHARLITVAGPSFFIGDVDVANESYCRRVIRRAHSHTFEIVGLAEGETTLTVWPEETPGTAPPPPLQLVVVVTHFGGRYGALSEFINSHLNAGLPQPEVNIAISGIPLSGKILVSGDVRTSGQYAQVRSYIESAQLPPALLVYEIRVACPCYCRTRHCFVRR
jgi:hypothetical protein